MDPKDDLCKWDDNADYYVESHGGPDNRSYKQLERTLWEWLGNLEHLKVLDVACGHGWLSQKLSEKGASVSAVDGSARLLKHAESTTSSSIRYIRYDRQGLPCLHEYFDRVVANMVLMDLSDIHPLLSAIRARMKPEARFLFSITHPCFYNFNIYKDNESGLVFRMVNGYLTPAAWRI